LFNKIKDIFKRNSIPTINFNPSIKNLTNTSFFNIGYNDRLLEVHSLIYSVVYKKSKAIAQLPLKLYKDDTIKDYKCIIKKKVIVKNNLSYIFDTCPNKYMTPYIFWRTMVAHKEIYGNAYAYIRHNNIGDICDILILDPNKVSIYVNNENDIYYKIYNDKETYIHNLDIIHLSSIYVTGYKGISFINCLKDQLTLKDNIIKINAGQMDKSIKAGAIIYNQKK